MAMIEHKSIDECPEPIQPLPSIKGINAAAYYLMRKYQTEEQRNAEDLNDKKCAWLYVVSKKGIKNLNKRDREFAERYIKEGIHYSMYFMFKEWLPQFIDEQMVKYGLK